jgi:hypothetical protein
MLERIAIPFVGHCFTFQILFPRIRECLPDAVLLLFLAQRRDFVRVLAGFLDHALGLIAELPRHLLVPLLHFFVRDIELGTARLVRRDLRGPGGRLCPVLPSAL